jgi:hypothetical protein
MIQIDKEFYSSPYYFLLRDKENKYSLYFSVEETLSEARKKDEVVHFKKSDVEKVLKYLSKTLKDKKTKNTKTVKTDLEELVGSDGSMSNSDVPILDPRLHPKKTMDQTIAYAAITNDPITRGYRTYYGESVEDELEEIDMSKAFGYDETEDLDGKETYEYYTDELEMEPEEAKNRTRQQGKDPSGRKDKKSKYSKHKNFIGRLTLSEIQKQKMIKVVEDILTKKKNSSDGDINKKDVSASYILKKNLKTLKKQADKEGLTISDLIKLLKSE